ncbi:MAG: transcriptional regulator [Thermoprotei archaeon]|nr:MAG: transcriptional regulator [Thermoprotei archaeon]RLE99950.1 MAG: transcriptional regulator [Thermoprotei archaeon]HDI74461.1 CBS domain-containing protein [Thermoprotei archaeon]
MSSLPTPQYIRSLRKRAGLTQKEVARRAGVSQSLIARIEAGTVDPRLSTLRKILTVLEDALKKLPKARDVMKSPVITVNEEDPVRKAAQIMWDNGISQIPVIDKHGRVIGTIFEDNIVNSLLSNKESTLQKPVKEIMGAMLPIVSPNETLDTVIQMLAKGMPAVLVMDGEKLLGIITKSDIIAYQIREKTTTTSQG